MASNLKYCYNLTKQTVLAERLKEAYSFLARLRGLLYSPQIQPGDGLAIAPCNQIHMIGMKYPIDVVFLNRDGLVVGLVQEIGPGKVSKPFLEARSCVELPAGTIAGTGTECGDRIFLGTKEELESMLSASSGSAPA